MLKFEGKFKVGDLVKAYDFQPMRDREDRFVVGIVKEEGSMQYGFKHYKIECVKSSHDQYDNSEIVCVPHEVSFMEYDNRIEKVA